MGRLNSRQQLRVLDVVCIVSIMCFYFIELDICGGLVDARELIVGVLREVCHHVFGYSICCRYRIAGVCINRLIRVVIRIGVDIDIPVNCKVASQRNGHGCIWDFVAICICQCKRCSVAGRACLLDGEGVGHDVNGLTVFAYIGGRKSISQDSVLDGCDAITLRITVLGRSTVRFNDCLTVQQTNIDCPAESEGVANFQSIRIDIITHLSLVDAPCARTSDSPETAAIRNGLLGIGHERIWVVVVVIIDYNIGLISNHVVKVDILDCIFFAVIQYINGIGKLFRVRKVHCAQVNCVQRIFALILHRAEAELRGFVHFQTVGQFEDKLGILPVFEQGTRGVNTRTAVITGNSRTEVHREGQRLTCHNIGGWIF